MRMFRSRKASNVLIDAPMFDKKNLEMELECLGQRLDAVRQRIKDLDETKFPWAHRFWSMLEQRLITQWKMTLYRFDSNVLQGFRDRPYNIDYDWWEGDDGIGSNWLPFGVGFGKINDWFENFSLQYRLDDSWERARRDLLERARRGQA